MATNDDRNWDVFNQFVNEFKNESDRAAVILGAAKLDALLFQILDRHFKPSLASTDELLDGDSPLSTFSAKIHICYRLGLISADFAKTLNVIRKLRNAFAHEVSGASLASGPQADRLNSLLLPWRPLPFFKKFRRVLGPNTSAQDSSDFKVLLTILAGRLESLLVATPTISHLPWELLNETMRQTEYEPTAVGEGAPNDPEK